MGEEREVVSLIFGSIGYHKGTGEWEDKNDAITQFCLFFLCVHHLLFQQFSKLLTDSNDMKQYTKNKYGPNYE